MYIYHEPRGWDAPYQSNIEHAKEEWIKEKIHEICKDICRFGERGDEQVYDMLWVYIEDNLDKYTEGGCYE